MDSRELARAMVGATPSASLASIDERLRRNQTAQTNLSRMRRVMAAVGATDAMHVYQKSEGGAYAPAAWIDEGLLPCSERDLRVLNIVRGDDHLGAFSCGDVLVCTKNQGNTDEDEIERFMPGINGDVGIVNNPSSGITVTEAHEIVATGKDMRHAHATTVHKS
eukprot:jgi/Tetstr1/443276/TSEL_031310.t1